MKTEDGWQADLRRALRGQASPTDCPSETRWLAFAAGEAAAAEEDDLREHLAGCSRCVELAQDAGSFAAAMADTSAPEIRRRSIPAWALALAATVAVAIAAGILIERRVAPAPTRVPSGGTIRVAPSPGANPWRDLRIPAAPYIRKSGADEEIVFRSDEEPAAGAAGAFDRAMDQYGAGDFARAERELARFLDTHPGHREALLYRGASLAQLGRVEEAIRVLEETREQCSPKVCHEADWQLALVRLKEGRFQEALATLETVASTSGDHRLEAQRLRDELTAHLGAAK
jgi:tetratricopeptide (TPR) repeat protein